MRKDYERPRKAIKVSLETVDGKVFDAELMIFHGESLANAINGSAQFIEITDQDGKISLLAKSFIRRLTPELVKEEKSEFPLRDTWRFESQDPYIILNVSMNASDEEVRDAYHKLVRTYHPDKFANLGLPSDMVEYGESILKKINAAYEIIVFERSKTSTSAA
jgi:hypothetical protein